MEMEEKITKGLTSQPVRDLIRHYFPMIFSLLLHPLFIPSFIALTLHQQ
jgi:hypothetical protein